MTSLDPRVEIPKLTDKHRIVYRHKFAPESVESGLYADKAGDLRTMPGDAVLAATGAVGWCWLGVDPTLILEAVIPPALVPYKGMQMTELEGDLWTYWPDGDEDYPWVDTAGNRYTEEEIAAHFAAGKLVVFTPEVPA